MVASIIKRGVKKVLRRCLGPVFRRVDRQLNGGHEPPPFSTSAYSQEGEDMVLARIFERQQKGFYVDVGAHHPQRFSNTYLFYLRGWRGINVDAMPGSMKLFEKLRPEDLNLEVAISNSPEKLTYHAFNEPALNGFDKDVADEHQKIDGYEVIWTRELHPRTLRDVLGQHLPQGQKIDFLSIDVEGLDLQVLLSNDWSRYKPTLVLVEVADDMLLEDVAQCEVARLLGQHGYGVYCRTPKTVIFKLLETA